MTPTTASRRTPTHSARSTGATKLWLPYPRRHLIAIHRCPDCGWHPETQGHHPDCPAPVEAAEPPVQKNGRPRR